MPPENVVGLSPGVPAVKPEKSSIPAAQNGGGAASEMTAACQNPEPVRLPVRLEGPPGQSLDTGVSVRLPAPLPPKYGVAGGVTFVQSGGPGVKLETFPFATTPTSRDGSLGLTFPVLTGGLLPEPVLL